MRIICLDIGSKRIGVAGSDPLGLTAQGLCVIERKGDAVDFKAIANIILERDAEKMIIGLPLDEEGKVGVSAKRILKFIDRIKGYLEGRKVEVDIETWDERYSTAIAEERLINADVSRSKRRKVIDKMAAVVILEDYLAAH